MEFKKPVIIEKHEEKKSEVAYFAPRYFNTPFFKESKQLFTQHMYPSTRRRIGMNRQRAFPSI